MSSENPKNIGQREFARYFRDILLILASVVAGWAAKEATDHATENYELPQGYWQMDPHIQNGHLITEVTAYMLDPHAAVQYVDITIKDAHGDWENLCRVAIATKTNTYVCDDDTTSPSFKIPLGATDEMTFKVVGTNGKVSDAPGGSRILESQ